MMGKDWTLVTAVWLIARFHSAGFYLSFCSCLFSLFLAYPEICERTSEKFLNRNDLSSQDATQPQMNPQAERRWIQFPISDKDEDNLSPCSSISLSSGNLPQSIEE